MGLIIGLGGKSAGKAGASSYVVAWDGESTPVVSEIPAGVVITYDGTSYTGTLVASKDVAGKIYLVSDGIGDEYYRYVVSKDGDTYSWIPLGSTEIDLSDYATKESVAELEQQVSKKANKDGYYGGMTVGSAENLVGRGTVDAEYAGVRTSAGSADIGSGSAAIARMKGQSFVWNQQVDDPNCSDYRSYGIYDVTMSLSSGEGYGQVVLSGTAGAIRPKIGGAVRSSSVGIDGHKYFSAVFVKISSGSASACLGELNGAGAKRSSYVSQEIPLTDAWQRISIIYPNHTAHSSYYLSALAFYKEDGSADATIQFKGYTFFDLTLLFGAGNEPSTVEEFDAWRKEMGLTLDYYAYNPGEVINNKAAGILTRGFNLYNPSTGKAFLPGPYSDYPHEYEICGTFSSISFTDINGNTSVPTLTDGKFFNVDAPGELTVVGGNNTDTLVHLVWSGWRNEGEPDYAFEPYWENTLNLNLTQLTGKLNGAGESVVVFPNGLAKIGDVQDEIVGNKAIKRIGVVDMGTLGWARQYYGDGDERNYFRVDYFNQAKITVGVISCLTGKYASVNNVSYGSQMSGDKTIAFATDGNKLCIRDLSYTDAASLKISLSGVLLYYELATPEEYIIDTTPDWNYRVDDFGTEQVLPSYDPSNLTAPIAYDVQYAMNAVDAIRRLPDNYVERSDVKQTIGQSEKHVLSQKGVDANYAKKVGVENDLVVGAAKALAGNQRQEKEFSTMVMDGADGIAKINEAMGKSLVWNQLVRNGNFSEGTTNWIVIGTGASVSDNVLTATVIESASMTNVGINQMQNYIESHKYYLAASIKTNDNSSGKLFIGLNNSAVGVVKGDGVNGSYVHLKGFVTYSGATSDTRLLLGQLSARYGVVLEIKNVSVIDLTQMFGAGNEPATVEEFEKLFPLPYYAYNAGTIISNKTQSLGVTGFNLLNLEGRTEYIGSGSPLTKYNFLTEKMILKGFASNGYLMSATISEYSISAGSVTVKSGTGSNTASYGVGFPVRVLPNTRYYLGYSTNDGQIGVTWIAFDGSIISDTYYNTGRNLTSPSGAYWLVVTFRPGAVNTQKSWSNINLNLFDPNRNGTYEPYKHADLPLNLSTITGKLNGEGESVVIFPDGLRSAGTVYDSLLVDEDGYARKAVKRMGKVDLGTLEWSYYTNTSTFYSMPTDATIKAGSASDCVVGTSVYEKLPPVSSLSITTTGNCYWWRGAYYGIAMRNPNITDVVSFKSAINGVMAIYELATPETYDLDEPIPMTFMAHHGGTITQTPQAPESAPMRMNVTFAIDAVSTINGLPQNYVSKESLQAMLAAMQSAGIFSGYTMTFNATTGKYEFTFTVSNS